MIESIDHEVSEKEQRAPTIDNIFKAAVVVM